MTTVIEQRMKLKVNSEKSAIRIQQEVVFLGHTFLIGGQLGVSQKNEDRFKAKLKEMTRRKRGESLETIIKQLTCVQR